MRLGNPAGFAAGLSVAAAFLAVVFLNAPSVFAQQATGEAVARTSPALPAEVQAKLDQAQAALRTAQAPSDSRAQARALNTVGAVYSSVSQFDNALDAYKQALVQARSGSDKQQEVAALNGIAGCYRDLSENNKALETYQQALDLATTSSDLAGQAAALNGLGWVSSNTGENQEALNYHNRALPLARQAGDQDLEATILLRIGTVHSNLGEPQKALDFYNQALPIFRAVGDRNGEANALRSTADVDAGLGESQKALDLCNQALLIDRAAGDRDGEATTLLSIGSAYFGIGAQQKALASFSEALPILRAVGDRDGEAGALGDIGVVFRVLGEPQKALDVYGQALPILRAAGDRNGEAGTLNNIGFVYQVLGEPQKALDNYNQALPVLRAVGDRDGVAVVLNNIGQIYFNIREPQKALDYYKQALPEYRAAGDRESEGQTLNNIGVVYAALGEPQTALDFYSQALQIHRATGSRDQEAIVLNNICGAYRALADPQKELDYCNQALQIHREVGDRNGQAWVLNNMGLIYEALGEPQKALDFYNQALEIHRAIGDRDSEAIVLSNVGDVYSQIGETRKALEFYDEALPVAAAVNDPLLEAAVFHDLSRHQEGQQPELAIFYGKQAVNLVQQVRSNIEGLDKQLQQRFVSSKDDYYRDLANLLIDQGRLPEAQQVLNLLKLQEYTDYVRGDPEKTMGSLSLTPAEQQAEEDYQNSTAQLVKDTERWNELKKIKARTPEEDKEFQQLSDALDNAAKGLDAYYSRLYKLFGQGTAANRERADVRGNVTNLNQLIKNMPHVAAIYTTVTGGRYSAIVITGSAIVARKSAISEKDLNQKVAAFQQVLRDPSRDPRPLAQELYRTLVGPVESDLVQARAHTLVWSLDGVLRYIPMAALYDGKRYLIDSYDIVTFTPASIPWLAEQPDMDHVSALAMGISRRYQDDLNPLPAVVGELDEIVKDPQVPGANGVLPGSILLNGQFTEKAMESHLDGPHPIVHIASHFVFKPGDDNASYLLLAGKDSEGVGYHLTVADFNANRNLGLDNTDLLTLSACETGMSGSARNGEEIDGLGAVAQNKGARAVISSLWEVDDASTGALMADFYQRWADGGGKLMKVEALRQAQLDLLHGKAQPQATAGGRGISVAGSNSGKAAVAAGYTHPYYWAPFVLTGNWK
jgi:CHAT domain-containing protein/Tfp pilus assembly protein PilF